MGGFLALTILAGVLLKVGRVKQPPRNRELNRGRVRSLRSAPDRDCLGRFWTDQQPIEEIAVAGTRPVAQLVAQDVGYVNLAPHLHARVLDAWVDLLDRPVSDDPEAYVDTAVTMTNARQIAQQLSTGRILPEKENQVDRDVLRSIRDIGLVALAHVRDEYVLNPFDQRS